MMLDMSRRSFLSGAVALPFVTWLERLAGSLPAQRYVRYDATSPQGKAMLRTYASAVQQMKELPLSDPTSWIFQWYIHSPPFPKDLEIHNIFGPSPSPAKSLAQASWKTCQPHNPPYSENYFLPWHRAYLLFIEDIVRTKSGDPSFTLPYWNYTVDGPDHAVIPPEFRDPDSALYISNRNEGVNDGVRIDLHHDPSPINLHALVYRDFNLVEGCGFSPVLDHGLHGAVHVLTGNPENMGTIPWAARDPVFYAHHCQIDRIWYSWQKAGRTTPPVSGQFSFAKPDGSSATVDLSQFLDYGTMPYVYDSDLPMPASPPPLCLTAPQQQQQALAVLAERQPVTLRQAGTEVTLVVPERPGPAAPQPLRGRIRALSPEHRVFLVLRDLQTDAPPGVLYQVYLHLPRNASPEAALQHHVGYINFFEAYNPLDPRGDHHRPAFQFDVTDLIRRLAETGAVTDEIRVTIRPAGNRAPLAAARPTIGEIAVVRQ